MNNQEILDEINKTEEHLANMKKMLAECEYKRWEPVKDETYYYVYSNLEVHADSNYNTLNDMKRIKVYNCFRTKKQAEKEAEKILVRRMLEDIARRLNKGEKADYNRSQKKYYLFWNAELDELKQKHLYWTRTQGVVYCLSESFIDVAIQEIGKERLKKYLRGE